MHSYHRNTSLQGCATDQPYDHWSLVGKKKKVNAYTNIGMAVLNAGLQLQPCSTPAVVSPHEANYAKRHNTYLLRAIKLNATFFSTRLFIIYCVQHKTTAKRVLKSHAYLIARPRQANCS